MIVESLDCQTAKLFDEGNDLVHDNEVADISDVFPSAVDIICLLVVVVRGDARRHGPPQLRFPVAEAGTDVLARAPVSGDWRTSAQSSSNQNKENEKKREHPLTRIWPNARMSWRAKSAREHVVKHVMEVLLGGKIRSGQCNPNKGGVLICHCGDGQYWSLKKGDEQKNWVGARFAAGIWIYTKAVVCEGQRHMQTFKIFKLRFFCKLSTWLVTMSWTIICVSEMTIALQEAKVFWRLCNMIPEFPCVVHWDMLWFSAPNSSTTTC